jgi:hypothetical protein
MPQLLYTGLTRDIGRPRELEKNQEEVLEGKIEEEQYYESEDINLSIPVEESSEWSKLSHLTKVSTDPSKRQIGADNMTFHSKTPRLRLQAPERVHHHQRRTAQVMESPMANQRMDSRTPQQTKNCNRMARVMKTIALMVQMQLTSPSRFTSSSLRSMASALVFRICRISPRVTRRSRA